MREFLDPLDPGSYFDCGDARLHGLDDALLREAESRGRRIGDDSFQLVATDMGLIFCRPSISFAIAARWQEVMLTRPHGDDPVLLPVNWPTHGELKFTVSKRLAANVFRRWLQLRMQRERVVRRENAARFTAVDRGVTPSDDWEVVAKVEPPPTPAGRAAVIEDRRDRREPAGRRRQQAAVSRGQDRPGGVGARPAAGAGGAGAPDLDRSAAATDGLTSPSAEPMTGGRAGAVEGSPAVAGDTMVARRPAGSAAVVGSVVAPPRLPERTPTGGSSPVAPEPPVRPLRPSPNTGDETRPAGGESSNMHRSADTVNRPTMAVDRRDEPVLDLTGARVDSEIGGSSSVGIDVLDLPEVGSDTAGRSVRGRQPDADGSKPESAPVDRDAGATLRLRASRGQIPDPPVGHDDHPAVGYDDDPAVGYDDDPAVGYDDDPAVGYDDDPAVGYDDDPAGHDDHPAVGHDDDPAVGYDDDAADAEEREPATRLVLGQHADPLVRTIDRPPVTPPSWIGSPLSLVGALVVISTLVLAGATAVTSYRRVFGQGEGIDRALPAAVDQGGSARTTVDHRRFSPLSDPSATVTANASPTTNPAAAITIDGSGQDPARLVPQQGPRLCNSNYSGCVPDVSDVDCPNDGDGPLYSTEAAVVMGDDVYGLDTDGDGETCEPDQPRRSDLGSENDEPSAELAPPPGTGGRIASG